MPMRINATLMILCTALAASFSLFGCSRRPAAVRPPDIAAGEAAAAAIAQFDRDADQHLGAAEAEPCPGLTARFSAYDTDGDQRISREELRDAVSSWLAEGTGVMRVGCMVKLDGKPLSGATIVLQPESFLGDALRPARGVTNEHGQSNLSIDPASLPDSQQRVRGVQPGLYRVQITHGAVAIPDRYNVATTLGQEVSRAGIGPEGVTFELSSAR